MMPGTFTEGVEPPLTPVPPRSDVLLVRAWADDGGLRVRFLHGGEATEKPQVFASVDEACSHLAAWLEALRQER